LTAVITRAFVVSNYWECFFWCAIAIAFLGFWIVKKHADLLVGVFAFGLFGLSDYIEAGTGAWWRPWWLLALKVACILTFVILLYRHWRRSRVHS
jgi:hypothetical protein